MAIALANDNVASGARDNSSANTLTVTFTHTTTAGNLALISVVASGNGLVSSISDSRGNTWQVDKTLGVQGPSVNICSCLITTGHQVSDTLTVNLSTTSTYAAGIVSEWSGIVSTSWLDKTTSNSSTSGTPQSGVTATRSQADELLYAAVGHVDASDYTAGTNIAWTLLTLKSSGAGVRKISPEYFIASAVGTERAEWVGSFTNWEAALCTYKAAAAVATNYQPGFRYGFL